MKGNNNKRKGGKRKSYKGKDKFTQRQRDVESIDMESADKLPRRDGDRRRSNYHESQSNDWTWYADNPQMIKDYASFPFGVAVGNQLQTKIPPIDAGSIPGIMTLYFTPAVGSATDQNSPINVAMRRLYSFVRHQNSGHANYDGPDLMLYLVAMDSCYYMHSFMRRLIGIAQDYTPLNRYYPRALVTAMGIDFDDLVDNISNFRGFVNQYAAKLTGSLLVPNSMSYMARHSWMCDGIYVDSTTEKAQTYFYTPSSAFQFQLDSEGAGSVQAVTFLPIQVGEGNGIKITQLENFVNSLLNPLLANEDFNIMSGDILKAFGPGGVVTLPTTDETYKVVPSYNQEVLSQIENCTILPVSVGAMSVTQTTAVGTGYLVSNPEYTATPILFPTGFDNINDNLVSYQSVYGRNILLNFHHSDVQPNEVMVATRLTNLMNVTSVETIGTDTKLRRIHFTVPTMGSEIIDSAIIWNFVNATNGVRALNGTTITSVDFTPPMTNINDSAGILAVIKKLGLLSQFDWHPSVIIPYVYAVSTGTLTWNNPQVIFQDVDNYTTITMDNLINMTTTAMLSEFTIPNT